MSANIVVRLIGTVVLGLIGWALGLLIAGWAPGGELLWSMSVALLSATVGFAFTPAAIASLWRWIGRNRDVLQLSTSASPGDTQCEDGRVILDTNVIIDGRIADISQTGFIRETLLIPRFVLNELQHIANSPDPMRRNRGHRGVSILVRMLTDSDVPVQVLDTDFENTPEVDAKLVQLAKSLRCPIVTNDLDLSRAAGLQGIRVLNVNELANAIRPVVLAGDEMRLRIIQEGKEAGQGVGFLEDGTVVVVDAGRRYLNAEIDIVVTRVLQTAAARMVFAHPKGLRDNGGS
jgi:uncharacterized protein YacL